MSALFSLTVAIAALVGVWFIYVLVRFLRGYPGLYADREVSR